MKSDEIFDPANSKMELAGTDQTRLKSQLAWISTLITAISNFSVQYNFQSISIALLVMSSTVCTSSEENCKDGTQESWVASTASAVVFIGAIAGQLTMGYAGDVFGRSAAMIFTLSLMVVSALISALASVGSPSTIYTVIIVARFFLGVGVGGVYPLSATKAAEDAGARKSSDAVDVVAASKSFFWQTPGAMTPWLVAYILDSIKGISNEARWRLLLSLGAIPAALVVLLSFLETSWKKSLVAVDDERMIQVVESSSEKSKADENVAASEMLREWSTWKKLLATGGGWFLYDIAYYGVNLFGGEILSEISDLDDDNVSSTRAIKFVSQQQLIGLSLGIPACIFAIISLKYFCTTKTLQIYGFLFIAVCFFVLAVSFAPLRETNPNALFFFYCCLMFSLNYGPNITTFVLPAQTYPKKVRATFNGMSAALGKVGAFVGVYMFGALADATSYPVVMAFSAGFSLLGAIISYYAIDGDAAGVSKYADQTFTEGLLENSD